MCKKMTITTIILLLMCITVSFAWMMDVVGPSGNSLKFDLSDALYVSSDDLKIDISIEENNEFVPLYSYEEGQENNNELAVFTNKGPGDTLKFSIDIYNLSDLTLSVSVMFSEIFASHQDFYEYINIGMISVKGFSSYKDAPKIEEFAIKDKIANYDDESFEFDPEKALSINFLNNLKIPSGEEGVNIKFYIKLNTNASNTLQNQTFKIGKINFISV